MSSCPHESLAFDPKSGTYHLRCHHCGATWAAVYPDDESPRHEALLQSSGISGERQAPFYIRPLLQAHQLHNALAQLKTSWDPQTRTLGVNMGEVLTMLYCRPQAEALARFQENIEARYVGRENTKANREAILAEARDFLKKTASTYVPY